MALFKITLYFLARKEGVGRSMNLNKEDVLDLVFRIMFSSIFLGLGMEHLFQDEIIQKFMPEWMAYKRAASVLCGLVLVAGASALILGFRIKLAAKVLACFLILVTCVVHAPSLMSSPEGLPEDWSWLWVVFQRSNFVKNICLLGVCIHLIHYKPRRFTLENWLSRRG